ncbi:hypothetical protein ACFLXE_06290 [Chloroflexota bacterium]
MREGPDSGSGGWEAGHHDSCRVTTRSTIPLLTVGKNQVPDGYSP